MQPHLYDLTRWDRERFELEPDVVFRVRVPSWEEGRATDVQKEGASAIVIRDCGVRPGFVLIVGAAARIDRGATRAFLDTLNLPLVSGFDLAGLLPAAQPAHLAAAAIRLLDRLPCASSECSCGARWAVMFAGLAHLALPDTGPERDALEAAWAACKARQPVPAALPPPEAVSAASAALRAIAETRR